MVKVKEVLISALISASLVLAVIGISVATDMWPFNKVSGDVLTAEDWNEAVRLTGMAVATKQSGDVVTAEEWNKLASCANNGGGGGSGGEGCPTSDDLRINQSVSTANVGQHWSISWDATKFDGVIVRTYFNDVLINTYDSDVDFPLSGRSDTTGGFSETGIWRAVATATKSGCTNITKEITVEVVVKGGGGAPVITSLVPSSGLVGTKISIIGSGFESCEGPRGECKVTARPIFVAADGYKAVLPPPPSGTDTEIKDVKIPAVVYEPSCQMWNCDRRDVEPGDYLIMVHKEEKTSNALTFTVTEE
jgi:hypothetical protein